MLSSSQGVVLATAMAVSAGTIILFDLLRDKYSNTPQLSHNHNSTPEKHQIPRSCLSSSGDRSKKKKKRVHFAEDVKDTIGNGEEYRKKSQRINRSRSISCGDEINGLPANRMALYTGLLKDRLQRIQYSC